MPARTTPAHRRCPAHHRRGAFETTSTDQWDKQHKHARQPAKPNNSLSAAAATLSAVAPPFARATSVHLALCRSPPLSPLLTPFIHLNFGLCLHHLLGATNIAHMLLAACIFQASQLRRPRLRARTRAAIAS